MAGSISHSFPQVFLKSGAEKRLLHGHRWIYSNEIDVSRGDYGQLAAGESASLMRSNGTVLGSAYFNNKSLLCGRLYSREKDQSLSSLLDQRLSAAIKRREMLYKQPFYRAVYGDGDQLSGLIIDRFGDCWVLQLTTAGMYMQLDNVVSWLVENTSPQAIILHNDSIQNDESVASDVRVLWGECGDVIQIIENGTRFHVPVLKGQKTGWFYDHRESRAQLAGLCEGQRVLDVYSYSGAWGLAALNQGAKKLHAVDRSASALELLNENAKLNGVADRCETFVGEADQVLKQLAQERQQYDVVIVDPPAFIKRRKDFRSGLKAYHRVNQLAMKLLADDGVLASCSCSMHLPAKELRSVIATAAYKQQRQARLIYRGGLGMDHPVPATMPELDYLKTFFAQISPQ